MNTQNGNINNRTEKGTEYINIGKFNKGLKVEEKKYILYKSLRNWFIDFHVFCLLQLFVLSVTQ